MHVHTSRQPRRLTSTLFVPLLLGLVGCQQPDFASRRVTMRGERLTKTFNAIGEGEQGRWAQSARTAEAVRVRAARDVSASRANVDEFKRYWRRDWGRLTERTSSYRRRTDSSPEQIERYAIILFF